VVDARRLADVAFWDQSFGGSSLERVMQEMTAVRGDRLGAVAVGELPNNAIVELSGADLDIRVTEHVSAFPGTFSDSPWLIVDSNELEQAAERALGHEWSPPAALTKLLVKGDSSSVVPTLVRNGFPHGDVLTADSILRRPTFVAVSRAFRFLRTLALLTAVIVAIGIVLYLQARQRGRIISYALARRMGLRKTSHLAALELELGSMLLTSAIAGVILGLASAWLLYAQIDPLPSMAPSPLLRVPLAPPIVLVVALAAVTLAGALLAHRTAERANVAEQLRQA
jgi:hypothetical protein